VYPPRPLTDEPLALDLINTLWVAGSTVYDLLDSDLGTRSWLEERALTYEAMSVPKIRANLIQTRTALRAILEPPFVAAHRDTLNAVLALGSTFRSLGRRGPESHIRVDAEWQPAWLAASNLLELLETAPERLKKCANPLCVLHFFDRSPKNVRRWHDMKTCGNRAKAQRHHHKTRH
jgi:predicted RNA-binding Zn ribbon-like protein